MFLKKHSTNYLLLTAFAAGMSIMAIEMAASRLLAPYFGTSLFVWTNVLAIMMIALAIGYYAGGRIADQYASERLLYKIILATGAYLSLVPLLSIPITRLSLKSIDHYAVGATAFYFSLMVFLLVLPFVTLGMATPYILRLMAQRVDAVGHIAGKVFAWSNAGSIIGTFVPALLTIPLMGTYKSIILFAGLLMILSIIGLSKWILWVIPALSLLSISFLGKIKPTKGLIYDTESAYNYIQVVEEQGLRMLRLNEGHAEHSLYQKDKYLFDAVWDYYAFLPLLNHTKDALFIGLAAGTAARQYAHFFPSIKIDGVEIDPAIVEVGKQYFDLKEDNLNIIIKDGRVHLATTQKTYDTILIDAYKQPYIPFHLTTKEFFTEVKNHLNERGVVGINVGSTRHDSAILLAIQHTMKSIFKHVYVVEAKSSLNYLVWATNYELDVTDVETSHQVLNPLVNYIKRNYKEVLYDPTIPVFTDNVAPLEMYTEKMILDFAIDWKRSHR
ncbi:MAG: fused MFS/spermidine synthase [Bacteroidota bacterium]